MNQLEVRLHSRRTVHFHPAYLPFPVFPRVWFRD